MERSVFWLASAIVLYVYVGYPLFLIILSFFKKEKKEGEKEGKIYPPVALIISVYNEEKVIEEKIKNTLTLNYPEDMLEIVLVSDGSEDRTNEIIRNYSSKFDNIKLYVVKPHLGKNIALNKILPLISSEIIIFSDANSMYEKDSIKRLVRYFADDKIGCVIGELRYINKDGDKFNFDRGEGLYWKYESTIKRLESRLSSVLVANGSIFAIKRELYSVLEPDMANDFQIPMEIGNKGYKIVYEPEAVAYEKSATTSHEEFERKLRIINRGWMIFLKLHRKINGLRLFEFISHKLLRWLVGIFLILIFLSNIFLTDYPFYMTTFLLQLVFYGMAVIGIFFTKYKVFYLPFYFCLINFASLIALFNFLRGKRYITWKSASTTR